MSKYSLLIFDVDGTIADTDDVIVNTYIDLYKIYKNDSPIDIKKFKTFSGPPLNETLRNEFPLLSYDYIYSEYKRISKDNYPKYIKSFKNIKEVLLNFKKNNIKLAICSSKIKESIEVCLKLLDLENIFDYIVGLDSVINPKPDKEGIDKILNYFSINKSESLFIGDTDFDYLTAKNGGLNCVIMTMLDRKYNYCNENNVKFIKSYKELEGYILNAK